MPPITTTIPEGLTLKNGEELDLRVIVKNGEFIVTKVLRHTKAETQDTEHKIKLGAWNRK